MKQSSFTINGDIYSIRSRVDIQRDSLQSIIKKQHKVLNSIRCNCESNKELYLQVSLIKDKYYLKKYPKSEEHNEDCLFYSHNTYQREDEKGVAYKGDIFKESKPRDNADEVEKRSYGIKERAKANTYYNFCNDVISKALLSSILTFKKGKNFTFQHFYKNYKKALLDTNIISNGSVYDFCKNNKDYFFETGICDEKIFEDLKESDTKNIDLFPIEYDKEKKCYVPYEKNRTINTKRLKISRKLIINMDTTIKGPYFYTAIYEKGVIKRFHITPIFYDREYICFVDSGNERKYAKSLYDNNKYFIKPFSNYELDVIYPSFLGVKYINKFPEVIYTPDFLVVENSMIRIVEVSGYDDREYLEHLEKKERYYKKLLEQTFYFEYERFKKDENIELFIQNSFNWNGEYTVKTKKYEEDVKKWKELDIKEVRNYAFHSKHYLTQTFASNELIRREREGSV